MSSIVTFYSYKGGVGRSMALSNIAVLLARRGLKVLIVDWDLEAPGLERYFSYFQIKHAGGGLLRLFIEARDAGTAEFKNFVSTIDCDAKHPLVLLPSGREQDEAYSRNLEAFDWNEYFISRGGTFVERLRHQWRADFDIVLIDSRTGLSDTGGICTIQMPDIIVGMFTANYQSLYGLRDVMRLAQKARQNLAYDRMPFSVLPLPSRWGIQEFKETQLWLDRIAEAAKEFYDDWLPQQISIRSVVERVKIPQVDFFGFGEKLAVIEQGTTNPQGMGFVYDMIAGFLASDFSDLTALLGHQLTDLKDGTEALGARAFLKPSESTGYLYDVFVSHDGATQEVVLKLVEVLKQELAILCPEPPKIFIDVKEIRVGAVWDEELADALNRSKILLAFITPQYLSGTSTRREFLTFADRTLQTDRTLVVPAILSGTQFEEFISKFEWDDLRPSTMKSSLAHGPAALPAAIRNLAQKLKELIAEVPLYRPNWHLISEEKAQLISLGSLMQRLGWQEQIRKYQKTVESRERLLGENPNRPESLRNLSISYERMGTLMQRANVIERARAYIQKALEIRQQLVAQEPYRADHLLDLSISYDRMGNLMQHANEFEQARAYIQKALEIRQQLVAQEPYHTGYLRDLSACYERLANLMQHANELETARAYAEKALEIREQLVRQEPYRSDYLRDLSISYERLANLMQHTSEAEPASAYIQKALEIREQLVRLEPHRLDHLLDLSIFYNRVGDMLQREGRLEQAQVCYQKALEIREQLAQQEPNRADFLRKLSVSYNRMGDLMQIQSQLEGSRMYYRKALEIRERLALREPDRSDYLRDLSMSYERMGNLTQQMGAIEQAREYNQSALDIRERLLQQEPDRPILLRELSLSYNQMGGLMQQAGQIEQARIYYQKALELRERLMQQEDRPSYLRDLSISYSKMGDLMQLLGQVEQARGYYQKNREIQQRLGVH